MHEYFELLVNHTLCFELNLTDHQIAFTAIPNFKKTIKVIVQTTPFIAQRLKFIVLKANILPNTVRPVGILEKRSNRPTGSGTKRFAGPFFQK